jgi:hypothetical protein
MHAKYECQVGKDQTAKSAGKLSVAPLRIATSSLGLNRIRSLEVSRNHIIGLIIASIFLVVSVAMAHEVFDFGDKTPLTADPEFALMGLGVMMMVCVGIAVITVLLAYRHLTYLNVVKGLFGTPARDCFSRAQAFDIEHLLFLSLRTATSLRV